MRFSLFSKPPPSKPTDERMYTSFQIMRTLKIERNEFQNWMKGGFIKATVPSPGRGRAAKFTLNDIYTIAFFIAFFGHGFSLRHCSELAARCIPTARRPAGDYFVLQRKFNGPWYSPEEIITTVKDLSTIKTDSWDTLLVINIKRIRDDVDKALSKMPDK